MNTYGYMNTGIQGYTGIHGYRITWIQEYINTGIKRHRDLGIQGYRINKF